LENAQTFNAVKEPVFIEDTMIDGDIEQSIIDVIEKTAHAWS
jgi:hypothetical protein